MFSETYPDIHTLSQKLTARVALAKKEDLDFINSADVQLHDVVVKAEKLKYDYDLKETWLAKSRWTSLVRQYIDPQALDDFLNLIEDKMKGMERGQAFMRTNLVAARSTGKREARRWGSCIVGFGFRAKPKPSLSMHSRTTFLGYIGELDLALAYHIGKLVAERLGINHEDMSFVWHIEAAQFHSSRSLAWWFKQDKDYLSLDSKKYRHRPGLAAAIRQFNRYQKMDENGDLYADLSFASQLRPRKRWHSEVLGLEHAQQFEGGTRLKSASSAKAYAPLPSVPVDKLNFDMLKTKEGAPDGAGFIDPEDLWCEC